MLRPGRILRATVATPKDVAAALRVLGIDGSSATVNSELVRSQYLRLARLHHPDISNGDDQKMKVINTAYEMLQSSGVLTTTASASNARAAEGDQATERRGTGVEKENSDRFAPKAGKRRRRVPNDFADGDRWNMKSTLEWRAMTMMGTGAVSEEELRNPANHPFSHSRFFSFEEDITIYRMIRGGATVRQVARTLGKAPTFVERRLQNAQFKQRVMYAMRHEKRHQHKEGAGGVNMTERLFRPTAGAGRPGQGFHRVKEWEPTTPECPAPTYFSDMTLEEKGHHAGLLHERVSHEKIPPWRTASSKVGRSYANYARFTSNRTT
uniref:Uncharacterized protein TCIL3000_11_11650 n=1 Tax=Trypanosoma congolense (strain IL3000) TaxID=1068625 RepID=G0V202_TRYCI|nr:unnamed protein product [Trypanosoma congolense IL3000]